MKIISKLIKSFQGNNELAEMPQGEKGILQLGHRKYVGGLWEEIGKLQFEFLIKNGLKPDDIFMDIACGSLRAGIHLIPYLNSGNYLGIDKEQSLIHLGIKNELGEELVIQKKPEFIISPDFGFHQFSKIPNFAIAQSLFTHLPPSDIHNCFTNLKQHFSNDGIFFCYLFCDRKSYKKSS